MLYYINIMWFNVLIVLFGQILTSCCLRVESKSYHAAFSMLQASSYCQTYDSYNHVSRRFLQQMKLHLNQLWHCIFYTVYSVLYCTWITGSLISLYGYKLTSNINSADALMPRLTQVLCTPTSFMTDVCCVASPECVLLCVTVEPMLLLMFFESLLITLFSKSNSIAMNDQFVNRNFLV